MTAKVTTSKISGIGATLGQVSVSSGHTFEVDGVVDLTHCASQALQLPTGTTSQRPQNPLTGYLRWNTDTDSETCLLYTSPSPRDRTRSRMPSSA